MAKCEKCGVEVDSSDDLFKVGGLQLCEDCQIKSTYSQSQPCGGEK